MQRTQKTTNVVVEPEQVKSKKIGNRKARFKALAGPMRGGGCSDKGTARRIQSTSPVDAEPGSHRETECCWDAGRRVLVPLRTTPPVDIAGAVSKKNARLVHPAREARPVRAIRLARGQQSGAAQVRRGGRGRQYVEGAQTTTESAPSTPAADAGATPAGSTTIPSTPSPHHRASQRRRAANPLSHPSHSP